MKQKNRRSEKLPKYGTPLRLVFVSNVVDFPGYKEGINKGLPLFTGEELDNIKKHYEESGLTWEDIDRLLSEKGLFFKKATFRKYIQEGNISKAIGYKNTEKGRVAIFPPDTISHINFIQYFYKVMDGKHVDDILKLIENKQITYLDAIESNLFYPNLYASILHGIGWGDADPWTGIEKALKSKSDDRDKFMKMLDDISDKFDKVIGEGIENLISLLKEKTINVFDTIDIEEEVKNEQN